MTRLMPRSKGNSYKTLVRLRNKFRTIWANMHEATVKASEMLSFWAQNPQDHVN